MNNLAIDIAAIVISLVSLTLGVVNYLTELFRHKPHAKVSFMKRTAITTAGVYEDCAIEVVNEGESPFVVVQLGLYVRNARRFIPIKGDFTDGTRVYRRLDPGDVVLAVIPHEVYKYNNVRHVTAAFARVATGKEFVSKPIREDLSVFPRLV